jgi:hypothetical protein
MEQKASNAAFEKLLTEINSLPADQQFEALQQVLVCMMDVMDLDLLKKLRVQFSRMRHVRRTTPPECGGGASSLDLIDGHIALREIQGRRAGRK